ncbi:MAG: DUF4058 family protein [Planctomycetes bacterium]|nr:DUF4058 family protein [Planctomycetota bacterium]
MRMKSPFPGMDPFLESPAIWPDVHQRLITYCGDALQKEIGPRYYARMGERLYLEGPERHVVPDLVLIGAPEPGTGARAELEADTPLVVMIEPTERREVFLEIRDSWTGSRVVTVIEVLSPSNKRGGPGRDLYRTKQAEILGSPVHLVEVDLLRDGQPTVALPEEWVPSGPYRVVVSRAPHGKREVYPIGLRARLPRLRIPLVPPDPDVVLDLQNAFERAYENGAYGRTVDYARATLPPLSPADEAWARELLAG